ncbi:MAG: dCMP deaminase family protein [Kordiimonadaceae bacterium]|jgi:dCMP deaminase|nr:dCMP deaminase family protein [Kordiimonadaceae bacterium]
MKTISWDECFMTMAETVSMRSKDMTTKVGVIIVSEEKNHVAIGYNGFPTGMSENQSRWDNKSSYVVHAELNAVINAKTDISGWTVYTTMFPCTECTKMLLQTGVSRVVYKDRSSASVEDSWKFSKVLLEEMGISVERFTK